MKTFVSALAITALVSFLPSAHASSLKGSTVTGVLYLDGDTSTNYFATASADGTDTAIVGPGPEFTTFVFNFFSPSCTYTANLSAAKIAISDVCSAAIISEVATPDVVKNEHDPFQLILTDPAFVGNSISILTDNLGLGLPTVSGDSLTFDFAGGFPDGNKSTYAVSTAVTPEPASWQLLALGAAGLLGMAAYSRREQAGIAGLNS